MLVNVVDNPKLCSFTFPALIRRENLSIAISTDGKKWRKAWSADGPGEHKLDVDIDKPLDVKNAPAKYGYRVRVRLGAGARLSRLVLTTDVMAAPTSLPRLGRGVNQVVYRDETTGPHAVRVVHQWRETDAVKPLAPPVLYSRPFPDCPCPLSRSHRVRRRIRRAY